MPNTLMQRAHACLVNEGRANLSLLAHLTHHEPPPTADLDNPENPLHAEWRDLEKKMATYGKKLIALREEPMFGLSRHFNYEADGPVIILCQ